MAPRVSIGLPVHNGAEFLPEALAALLQQSFTDLEVVICDNASTDETEAICRDAAADDERVRYVRNAENLGAAPNFNKAFGLSRGEFFKWAAADDVHVPKFVAACVDVLDREPEIVLAYGQVVDIDGSGRRIHTWDSMPRATDTDPAVRFADVVENETRAFPIFGLARRDAMARTSLIRSYTGSDVLVLAELALQGRFAEVDDVLFLHREHDGRSTRVHPSFRERAAWFDTRRSGKPSFPYWARVADFGRASVRYPIGSGARSRCLATTARWGYTWKGRLWREAWWGLQDVIRRDG